MVGSVGGWERCDDDNGGQKYDGRVFLVRRQHRRPLLYEVCRIKTGRIPHNLGEKKKYTYVVVFIASEREIQKVSSPFAPARIYDGPGLSTICCTRSVYVRIVVSFFFPRPSFRSKYILCSMYTHNLYVIFTSYSAVYTHRLIFTVTRETLSGLSADFNLNDKKNNPISVS